jgi:RNA polymerase sigma factor (sigma-70 family)
MTGSVGDAEDIVQDAFLGLTRARLAGTVVADQKAYLTTAVTRLGINYLSSARVRRETYVGDWLPEPVVVPAGGPGVGPAAAGPGPAEHAELADSLSMAFLVLLEALSPVERAVFMLREVFGYGYPEIARATGKTEVNCRQIFTRARQRIAAGGQGRDLAPGSAPARRAEGEELARRFFEAAAGGDMDALLGLLAPDVVAHGDGGGKAAAGRAVPHRAVPPRQDCRCLAAAGLGQRPAGRRPVRHAGPRDRGGRAGHRRRPDPGDPLGGQPGQARPPGPGIRRSPPPQPGLARRGRAPAPLESDRCYIAYLSS